jgi:hypothetical protein
MSINNLIIFSLILIQEIVFHPDLNNQELFLILAINLIEPIKNSTNMI